MKDRYFFWIASEFHYIISKSIIIDRGINSQDVYYVCQPGRYINIGTDENICNLYDGRNTGFISRFLYYLYNKKEVNLFFEGVRIHIFSPFRGTFPIFDFFEECSFMEEGLGAYVIEEKKTSKKDVLKEMFRYLGVNLLLCFSSRNIKGYVMGIGFSGRFPKRLAKIACCSPYVYPKINSTKFVRQVFDLRKVPCYLKYNLPEKAFVIVLDRFCSKGRVYSIENYRLCVEKEIEYLKNKQINSVWLKLHPADDNSKDAFLFFKEIFESNGIIVECFTGILEYLALQDTQTTFIGTNSTILYYAPLLGKTNRSISFFAPLAEKDELYNKFIDRFGGTSVFRDMFSKNVLCI